MNTNRKYILVADDDPMVANYMRSILTADGFDCRVVSHGKGVFEEMPQQRPDLIILDRFMPDTTGDEVLATLKRDPLTADIPVLMVSGLDFCRDEADKSNIDADAYLAKPFSMDRLRTFVSALLRKKSPDRKIANATTCVNMGLRSREVLVDGVVHYLTPSEHTLLRGLAATQGCVVNSQQIKVLLESAGTPSSADVSTLIGGLQSHLGHAGEYIHDLQPAGFAFCAPAGTRMRV